MTNGERPYDHDSGPAIVISGFMGTGKSSVGEALSRILGLRFIDTDMEIEKNLGCSIAEIFKTRGEPYFRQIEKSYCMSLANTRGVVISTGGGSLLDPDVFDVFSSMGQLILLEASPDVLAGRIQDSNKRPLMSGDAGTDLQERIRALLDDRSGVYGKAERKYDTSHTTPAETAHRIAALVEIPSQSLELSLSPAAHESSTGTVDSVFRGRFGKAQIDIGRGVLSTLGDRLNGFGIGSEAFILMPANIRDLFGEQLGASLDEAGIQYKIVTIRDGDTEKNTGQAERIIDEIIAEGARRDATIVPVGGGVTGDIGGFVAAIFMRGIPLVHVPTTLLAQVDSSVGGKVGVNHKLAKNLIGTFYQPHAVLIDPCVLRTLPLSEISNGMAEVVKSAIIGSRELFEYLEQQMSKSRDTLFRDVGFLETCVVESVRIKTGIVNQDPFDKSIRRSLNLGHTVGHAIEASNSYRGIKHGQAVSLGTVVALGIAASRKRIDPDLVARTLALLNWCGLPTTLDNLESEDLRSSLRLDKKIKNRKIHFVLPTGLGEVVVADDVSEEEIFSTLEKGMS